ncbi:MAG: leucine-rich repeat domain-containing protein [bacterium]|nr:leucine-rich repeat domain-containing protein [bacterium]
MKKILKLMAFIPLFFLASACEMEDLKTYDDETQTLIRGEAATMNSGGATVYVDDGYKYFTGLGIYDRNSEITLTIESIPGYNFYGLYLDGKIVTESQTYTFKAEADEYIFKALYMRNYDYLFLNCDESRGEVFGSGEYQFGEEVTIMASPFLGYDFFSWQDFKGNVIYDSVYNFIKNDSITEMYANFIEKGSMCDYSFIGTKTTCIITGTIDAIDYYFVIPDFVTGISENAFKEKKRVEGIKIGTGVTKIEDNSFMNCDLKTILLSSYIEKIGENAFSGCDELEKVFYSGTSIDWDYVYIDSGNESLTNTTIYFYSETEPTEQGNYWHFVDNVPTIWENE